MQIPNAVVSRVVVSLAVAGVVAIARAQTPATGAPPAAGAHSDAHLGAILPDVLRWIWNDQK